MTEEQLQQIETTLALRLPNAYRQACLRSPFGGEGDSLFYDSPAQVIRETQSPLEEGDYDGAGWKSTFLAIGRTACGDVMVLDVALADSPIYCLSHEDHAITKEFPTLEAYLADCQREISAIEKQAPERARQMRRTQREAWIAVSICAASILFILIMLAVAWFSRR